MPAAGGDAHEPPAGEHVRTQGREWMPPRGEGDVLHGTHGRAPQPRRIHQGNRDREVQVPAHELFLHLVGIQPFHREARGGSLSGQGRHDRRQKCLLTDGGQSEGEFTGEG